MKLYELTEQYKQIASMLEETDDPQCILDTLESIEGDITEKVINIAKLKLQLDYEAEALKNEYTKLQAKKKARENHAQQLKMYLESQLISLGKDVKTPIMTVAMQNNAPCIMVTDEETYKKFTEEHYGEPQPPKVDSRLVLEDMKAGACIPGAVIGQTRSLRIR